MKGCWKIFFLLLLSGPEVLVAQYRIQELGAIRLDGKWQFAIDPADVGQKASWFSDQIKDGFDQVTVPHCFTTDPRFRYYTGTAWYRKHFQWSPQPGKRVLLHFDAAFYKADIWLNEKKVGSHEGGYTPFHFDVTDFVTEGNNLLTVSVTNNTWKHGTIPGAKDHNRPNYALPGWLNFGGITRPVYLTVPPEVYTENIKVEALPDLDAGTASLKLKVRIRNSSDQPAAPGPAIQVSREGQPLAVSWKSGSTEIPAGATAIWEAEASLPAGLVKLWNLDTPNLYDLSVTVGADRRSARFGIRKIEVAGARLLLNGQPVKAAGGNRVIDYQNYGALEPDWLIEQDFRLMKEAGMELHRLTHYTPASYFYELADQYGMLIISEAGNWQLSPDQMDADSIRAKFKQQFTEMAERDWNHPSVFACSVGNEYLSEQPAGQRWTRDMIAFARELDPTRLYTFATMRLNILPQKPEDEASQYVDFICTNTYGAHARSLDHMHRLYPDKPVLISEWGARADAAGGEKAQAAHITDIVKLIRERPYVIGASWWAYNDYESRYQGTSPEGLRPWGIVTHDRKLRPSYEVHQREMAPLVLQKEAFTVGAEGSHLLQLRVVCRDDFPAYPVKQYTLRIGDTNVTIPDLHPGEQLVLELPVTGFNNTAEVTVTKPTGFVILKQTLSLY